MKIFVDCETTNLFAFGKELDDPSQPYMVQLGALLVDDSKETPEVVGVLDVIIQPNGHVIDNESIATKLHGVTHERAVAEGITIVEALTRLEAMAAMADTHIAHNMSFDMAMINLEAHRIGMVMKIRDLPRVCTMKQTTEIIRIPSARGYKYPKLKELYMFCFGREPDGQHSAFSDAKACMECFYHINKQIPFKPVTKEEKAAAKEQLV